MARSLCQFSGTYLHKLRTEGFTAAAGYLLETFAPFSAAFKEVLSQDAAFEPRDFSRYMEGKLIEEAVVLKLRSVDVVRDCFALLYFMECPWEPLGGQLCKGLYVVERLLGQPPPPRETQNEYDRALREARN